MRIVARLRWAPLLQAVTSLLYCAGALWLVWPVDRWSLAWALAGFFIGWPLVEWWMHRVLFHRLFRHEHWDHHADPQGDLSVVPPIMELILAMLFGLMVLAMGMQIGASVFSGFTLGYALYNDAHWCMHAGWWPRRGWLGAAARRHAVHHQGIEANYNVLLPVGDWLFRTYRTG